jgi:hypothetical protein
MGKPLPLHRSTEFIVETCCYEGCGIEFCFPVSFWDIRWRDGKLYYCPNGHAQQYIHRKTLDEENKRLTEQLEKEKQRTAFLQSSYDLAERRRVAAQGRVTKVKKQLDRVETRVKNGVCPCCNRTFENLARHMKASYVLKVGRDFAVLRECETMDNPKLPDKVEGYLEIGLDKRNDVIINHAGCTVDVNGIGHFVFSLDQAQDLINALTKTVQRGIRKEIIQHKRKLTITGPEE